MYTETKKVRTSDSTIRPINEPSDGHVAPQNTEQNNIVLWETVPIPVAARSKAWVCGRSLAGIAGSNLAGGMDVCRDYCVLSGRGLCDWPITRPEESYQVWCVRV
jgi:hypothetical protein